MNIPLQLTKESNQQRTALLKELEDIVGLKKASTKYADLVQAMNDSALYQQASESELTYSDKRTLERTLTTMLTALKTLDQISRMLPKGELNRLDCITLIANDDSSGLGSAPMSNLLAIADKLAKGVDMAIDSPRQNTKGDHKYLNSLGMLAEAFTNIFPNEAISPAYTSSFFKLADFWFKHCLGISTDATKNGYAKTAPSTVNVQTQIKKFLEARKDLD